MEQKSLHSGTVIHLMITVPTDRFLQKNLDRLVVLWYNYISGFILYLGGFDMKRTITRKRKDKRIFRRTANKTKAVNINNTTYRGGIRL